SPEAVAAAARVGDVSAGAAWAGLLAVLGGLAFAPCLFHRAGLLADNVMARPAAALTERARDVLDALGHPAALDDAYAFEWDRAYFAYVAAHDPSPQRWSKLVRAPLVPLSFFYRRSPRRLVAVHRDGMVRRDDPPLGVPGMSEGGLDPRGRVQSFVAVPPAREPAQAWSEPVWGPLV